METEDEVPVTTNSDTSSSVPARVTVNSDTSSLDINPVITAPSSVTAITAITATATRTSTSTVATTIPPVSVTVSAPCSLATASTDTVTTTSTSTVAATIPPASVPTSVLLLLRNIRVLNCLTLITLQGKSRSEIQELRFI